MGWNISIKEINGDTKYKVWSTITDSYITDKWMDRKEIINWLFWHKFRKFADDFLEEAVIFPHHWSDKNGKIIMRGEVAQEFYDFKSKAIRDDKAFYKRFFEELDKHGIKINVKDDKYNLEN